MTIFLILGAVAGLYVLALLFRLASYALPVYAALPQEYHGGWAATGLSLLD